jgi:hypothetical protein
MDSKIAHLLIKFGDYRTVRALSCFVREKENVCREQFEKSLHECLKEEFDTPPVPEELRRFLVEKVGLRQIDEEEIERFATRVESLWSGN